MKNSNASKKHSKQHAFQTYLRLAMIVWFTLTMGVVGLLLGVALTVFLMYFDNKSEPVGRKAKRPFLGESRLTLKKQMSAEENNQLISVILPVITKDK